LTELAGALRSFAPGRLRAAAHDRELGHSVRLVSAVISSGAMSQPVIRAPHAALRGHVMLLTKRRPIDFGLVATCLCRLG